MTTLETLSNDLAAVVDTAAPFVAQVLGGRRPASGVVHGADTVVTTVHAIGRENGLKVRVAGHDEPLGANLVGWDPATGLAVLRTGSTLGAAGLRTSDREPKPGEFASGVGRSWSNALTASAGIVAVVGGPLKTGRRRHISRVFRITAPMHDGFAGGGVFDASGRLAGVATASVIRGFGVAIPVSIAWAAAAQVLATGTRRRGFVGLAVQRVELPGSQQQAERRHALVVLGVTPSSPADAAGIIVGDLLLEFDGQPVETPEELLDLLATRAPGQTVDVRTLRGGAARAVNMTIAERPKT